MNVADGENQGKEAQKEQVVLVLENMGYMQDHAYKAVSLCDVNGEIPEVVDWCLTWLDENPWTDQDIREAKVKEVVSMGFTLNQADSALRLNDYDVPRAIDYLFVSQNNELNMMDRIVKEEQKRLVDKNLDMQRSLYHDEITQVIQNIETMGVNEESKVPEHPEYLSYGAIISLQANNGMYIISKTNHESLDCNSTTLVDECKFTILNPDDFQDRSPIVGGDIISLLCSDGCYIGVEANGSVHSNRTQFGILMKWKIIDTDTFSEGESISSSARVMFESRLHTYMQSDNGGECHAKCKDTTESHKFGIIHHGIMLEKLHRQRSHKLLYSFCIGGEPGTHTGSQLWANLRNTYRLRALNIRRSELKRCLEEVAERQKALLMQSEDRSCIICYETEPNTVILECGHICVCMQCGPLIKGKECPICRSHVDDVLEIRK